MKHSILLKIFIRYSIVIVALSALIIYFSFREIRSHQVSIQKVDAQRVGEALKPLLIPELISGNFGKLQKTIKGISEKIEMRVTLILSDGRVVADSGQDPAAMDNHLERPEFIEARDNGRGMAVRYSSTMHDDMIYVALRLDHDSKTLGYLRISTYLEKINSLLDAIQNRIIRITALIILLSLIPSAIFARNITRRIRKMNSFIKEVSSGDFDAHLSLKGSDEISFLGQNLKQMSGKIKKLFSDITDQKEELARIISSVSDGLLVVDADENISIITGVFKKLKGKRKRSSGSCREIIRVPVITSLIKKTILEKKSVKAELDYQGRKYLCNGKYIKNLNETVLVAHDITDQKNLEKIKKDLIANVSHELRTPLTAIKGYIETLQDEIPENLRSHLDVAARHTERLIYIVEDLLTLSKLEEEPHFQNWTSVRLDSLLEGVYSMMLKKAEKKNLKLKLALTEEITLNRADSFQLEQLFINLIDNAIKYTEKGKIRIELFRKGDFAVVKIKDTGIGIAAKHFSRLYERFYVVDKSRSRTVGGTGLGLSIAKHIVMLHNGKIDLESTPGMGSVFRISLPLYVKIHPFCA